MEVLISQLNKAPRIHHSGVGKDHFRENYQNYEEYSRNLRKKFRSFRHFRNLGICRYFS